MLLRSITTIVIYSISIVLGILSRLPRLCDECGQNTQAVNKKGDKKQLSTYRKVSDKILFELYFLSTQPFRQKKECYGYESNDEPVIYPKVLSPLDDEFKRMEYFRLNLENVH